jgi:hypothetical protein
MKSYPTVDAAYHEMTFSLGLALTQWQFVELKLFQLYALLYGQSDGVGLNISFHEMGLDVRLRIIEALIKARTNKKELHKSWAHVKDDVYKQKRLRDKLAHWTVMTGSNQDGTYYAYLSPPSTDLKAEEMAADPQKAGAIDAPTLQEAAIKDFQFVSAAIHRFMMAFPQWS